MSGSNFSKKHDCETFKKAFIKITEAQDLFDQDFSEARRIRNFILAKISRDFLESKINALREVLPNVPKDWQDFYWKNFRIDLKQAVIKIPEKREGFNRLIIIPQGLTLTMVEGALNREFKTLSIDVFIAQEGTHSKHDRTPAKSYAIFIRDRKEPDEELADKSYNLLRVENVKTMTLLERLILELKYYNETGEHLDIQTTTLCAGSRYSNIGIPAVLWDEGKENLVVLEYGWESRGSALRAREVVA